MTRGRPSSQAIEKGAGIAAKRGVVIEINPKKKSPVDLYVIRSNDIVAVKVKRIRSRIREPKDLLVFSKTGSLISGHCSSPSRAARDLDACPMGNLAVFPGS